MHPAYCLRPDSDHGVTRIGSFPLAFSHHSCYATYTKIYCPLKRRVTLSVARRSPCAPDTAGAPTSRCAQIRERDLRTWAYSRLVPYVPFREISMSRNAAVPISTGPKPTRIGPNREGGKPAESAPFCGNACLAIRRIFNRERWWNSSQCRKTRGISWKPGFSRSGTLLAFGHRIAGNGRPAYSATDSGIVSYPPFWGD